MDEERGEAAGAEDAWPTCFALMGGTTLVALVLTEQFASLPGAAAAIASTWYLIR